MKVKLTETITVNDDERRAIAHYNDPSTYLNQRNLCAGKASHKEVLRFLHDKEAPPIKKVLLDYYGALAQKYVELAGES